VIGHYKSKKAAYYLFNINTHNLVHEKVKFIRQARELTCRELISNMIKIIVKKIASWKSGLDFHSAGESVATINIRGVCRITDVDTNICYSEFKTDSEGTYYFRLKLSIYITDNLARCRWSNNAGEALVYLKYKWNNLNMFDPNKKALVLRKQVQLEKNSACGMISLLHSSHF
jgi:hypothetical protein